MRKDKKENLPIEGKATTKGLKRPNPSVCIYHGILLGLLGYKDSWSVSSNLEAGEGYSDILVEIEPLFLFWKNDFKYKKNFLKSRKIVYNTK